MGIQDDTLYKELLDQQQDLLVKFSPEGRLMFVNRAYCEAMGKKEEELVGNVFMPMADERYADALATRMTSLFRPPYACIVEQWISSPKGPRCISWSARSITGGDGKVTAIVASGRDVTEDKRKYREMVQRDSQLMLLVESGTPMYYTHTSDHILNYVSPRIQALLGGIQKSGKRVWTDYLTDNPINAKGLERTLKAISTGRREPPYRLEFTGRNGRRVKVEVNEIPVIRNHVTIAIVGSLVDVTEKMKVEEGLIEAELLLKDYGGHKKKTEGEAAGPFAALKSLFSRKAEKEEEDLSFDLPDCLK